MPYQNNNNRITPKMAGKTSITPQAEVVNKEVKYQPDLAKAQGTAYLAQALSDLGKGIIDFDQSGIMQQKAKEQAIELVYQDDAEGKNRHEWIEAQKNVLGLHKFNPYIKDTYKDLAAQDYYQKAIYELTNDSNFYKKSNKEIQQFIQNKKDDLRDLLKESGINTSISSKYLEGFHTKCNDFYGQYINKNATWTYELSLSKLANEGAKAFRVGFYDVPKGQQQAVMNTVISNIMNNHQDIPKDDLINKVLIPMAVNTIKSHTGTIEQADFINALKGVSIDGVTLSDIDPELELKLRDTFKTVNLERIQEEELEYKLQKQKLERSTQQAKEDFYKQVLNNPDADMTDLAKDIVQQYGIEGAYDDFLSDIVSYKSKLASLEDINSDKDTLRLFTTQYGLDELDREALTKAYVDGQISRKDYLDLLTRENNRVEKLQKAEDKAETEGYKAVFEEVKSFGNNIDTKKKLRNIKTGDNNESTAYADYFQLVASVNSDVNNNLITKAEGQKRLKELQDIWEKKYLTPKQNNFTPRNLLSKKWRAVNLKPLNENNYDEKAATESFKRLRMFAAPVKITSGIKDKRTVTLADGTTKTSSHQGYDLRAKVGTPISMPPKSGGRLLYKGEESTMGKYALIEFDSGDYMLLLHLRNEPIWNEGQYIPAKRMIAQSGNTGNVAPHGHVEFYARNGVSKLTVEQVEKRLGKKINKGK